MAINIKHPGVRFVVHKFVSDAIPGATFEVELEPSAQVLYFAKDTRSDLPALWVARPVGTTQPLVKRTFVVFATGQEFACSSMVSHGFVRLGQFIFHGFEVTL